MTIEVTKIKKRKPWEMQEEETAKNFKMFQIYLRFDPDSRTYDNVSKD